MAPFALPLTEVLVVADGWRAGPMPKPSSSAPSPPPPRPADAGPGDADFEAELAVMLTDDAGIRTMNRNWRGIDKPTNVLSFPACRPRGRGGPDDAPRMLGDIAIAYRDDAPGGAREEKPFDHHLGHLAVHGFLHLMGYDHEMDGDAEAMEASSGRSWRNSAFRIRMRIGTADGLR